MSSGLIMVEEGEEMKHDMIIQDIQIIIEVVQEEVEGIDINIRIHHGVKSMEGIKINQISIRIIMTNMVRVDTVNLIRI